MSRLTVISQVYPPDPAAVGQHMADVAEAMAQRGWRVTVFTSARGYEDPSIRYPLHEQRRGVHVRRFRWSSFGKRSIAVRLAAQSLFMLQACTVSLLSQRPDVILASTSPPFAGFFAAVLAWLRGARLVWWVMDLNPDQMIAAGKIGPHSITARVFNAMNKFTLSKAARVIALDRFMEKRLQPSGNVSAKGIVIPPWAPDEKSLAATQEGIKAFRQLHGLTNKVVVMYSGNHALQHPLDTLLATAGELKADDRFMFVFVGGGAGKATVEQRIRSGAKNIISLPYQSLETLGNSLQSADLHVVSMGQDMVGIVHPCKIYGLLAIGKPIVLFGPEESAAGEILAATEAGWIVAHGDTPAAVQAITEAAGWSQSAKAEAAGMLQRQSELYSRKRLLESVCQIIEARSAG